MNQKLLNENTRKQLIAFKLEIIAFGAIVFVLALTQTTSFNNLLVSTNNTSGAFKFITKHSNLNNTLLTMATRTGNNKSNGSILSVASALDGAGISNSENFAQDQNFIENQSKINGYSDSPEYSAIIKPSYSVTSIPTQGDSGKVGIYKVAEGDTPITIASRFNVSLATLLIENNLNEQSIIKPGQELKVLVMNGITHEVKSSDSLESLSKKYGIDENSILDANDVETDEDLLIVGTSIIIPKDNLQVPQAQKRLVNNSTGKISATSASAPDTIHFSDGDMIWPTTSRVITQYYSKGHNGLDISGMRQNPGPSIFAVKDGFVTYAGWQNGGWGNTIVINIGGGITVRYAHLATIVVEAGAKITQGDVLGRIGNTGRSTGPHLHFTIYKNGVAQNPLLYVKP